MEQSTGFPIIRPLCVEYLKIEKKHVKRGSTVAQIVIYIYPATWVHFYDSFVFVRIRTHVMVMYYCTV